MNSRVTTLVLAIALTVSTVTLVMQVVTMRPPGNNQGYSPAQPIAYSHRLHAGELAIPCQYCHAGAESSRHAGIPPASTCMNCHRFVTAARGAQNNEDELAKKEGREPKTIIAPELAKLYDYLGLDANRQSDPAKTARPIPWQRVHRLPDFVMFDHRAHIASEIPCQRCHGPVETMERLRQDASLSMGWCVQCHRDTKKGVRTGKALHPSTDCATCHY